MNLDELGLPPVMKKIAAEERGLVLVTGTTGSGKSTSLAAMIDHINANRTAHVITIEDPIEYLHRDLQCIINQREIGVDTRSFAYALRSALRQDPDVILVGEMRDMETIETAMHAAETGHLVFSTLHTLDATETINRIISVFPPHQQKQIRLQLASVLKAAIAPAPDPAQGRHRPLPRRRSADRHALREGLHRRQGQDAPDRRRDCAGHVAVRHADVRSVDLQPVHEELISYEEALRLGDERRRIQLKVRASLTTADGSARQMANTIFSKQRRQAGHAGRHPRTHTSRPGRQARAAKPAAVPAKRQKSRAFGS
jgi:twitching motility protein PilT